MHHFTRGAFISSARIAEKVFSFLIIVIASRKLSSENIGVFFYYFSLVSLFIPLMDMGFDKLLLQRWWKQNRDERNQLLGKLLCLKLVSGSLALGVVILTDVIINGSNSNQLAVIAAFAAIYISELGELIRQPAHAENIVTIDVVVPVFSRLLTLIIFLIIQSKINQGYQLLYIYAFSNLIGTLISCLGLRGYRPKWFKSTSRVELWRLVKAGVPFSLTHLFVMTSLYIDTVFIGYFKGMSEVGDYNAAYKIILAVAGVGGGVCYALFPMISKSEKIENRAKLFNQTLRVFIINFGTCMVGGIVLGSWIIEFLYQDKFPGAAVAFQILCVLILFSSITNLAGQTLEAIGKQKVVMKINLTAALFNVIANLLLIPKYGINAAAFTTIVTEGLILTTQIIYAKKTSAFGLDAKTIGKSLVFILIIVLLYLSLPWVGEELAGYLGVPDYKLLVAFFFGCTYFAVLLLSFRNFWLFDKSRDVKG